MFAGLSIRGERVADRKLVTTEGGVEITTSPALACWQYKIGPGPAVLHMLTLLADRPVLEDLQGWFLYVDGRVRHQVTELALCREVLVCEATDAFAIHELEGIPCMSMFPRVIVKESACLELLARDGSVDPPIFRCAVRRGVRPLETDHFLNIHGGTMPSMAPTHEVSIPRTLNGTPFLAARVESPGVAKISIDARPMSRVHYSPQQFAFVARTMEMNIVTGRPTLTSLVSRTTRCCVEDPTMMTINTDGPVTRVVAIWGHIAVNDGEEEEGLYCWGGVSAELQ